MDIILLKGSSSKMYYSKSTTGQDDSHYNDDAHFDEDVGVGYVGGEEVRVQKGNVQLPTKTNTDGLFVVRKLHLVIAVVIHSIIIVALVAVSSFVTHHVTKHGETEALTIDGVRRTHVEEILCQCGNLSVSQPFGASDGDSPQPQLCLCNMASYSDVGWSTWSSWDSCSATCGIGQTQRRRQCDNIKSCDGDSMELQVCFNTRCPDTKSSFSVQNPASRINDYLTFSRVTYNLGGDFNASTGVFTCTRPGVYVFSFSLVKTRSIDSRVDMVACYLHKNNMRVIGGGVFPTDDDTVKGNAYASHTTTLHLNVTDTVGLFDCTDPSSTLEEWTSFSGFLLYPD